MDQAINIIFSGPPGPESSRFVEVEIDDGKSVSVGKWIKREDGLWVLRIDLSERMYNQMTQPSSQEDRVKIVKLRQALVGLVGASEKTELMAMEQAVIGSGAQEGDKAAALHAIRTLIEIPE